MCDNLKKISELEFCIMKTLFASANVNNNNTTLNNHQGDSFRSHIRGKKR